MLIKDLETGRVREYGKDCHDSLAISPDGRTLSYYNLQCGEGSRYGCFRFVMEDGEVPENSQTPDAMYAECYFNIGGFPSVKQIRADERNNVLSTLSKLIESDYNSKECKLLLADLCEMLLDQLKEQNND